MRVVALFQLSGCVALATNFLLGRLSDSPSLWGITLAVIALTAFGAAG